MIPILHHGALVFTGQSKPIALQHCAVCGDTGKVEIRAPHDPFPGVGQIIDCPHHLSTCGLWRYLDGGEPCSDG